MAVTTMNPIYTSTEIARQLKMSKASWAVTDRQLVGVIKEAIQKLGQTLDQWKDRIIVVDKEPGKQIFNPVSKKPYIVVFVRKSLNKVDKESF